MTVEVEEEGEGSEELVRSTVEEEELKKGRWSRTVDGRLLLFALFVSSPPLLLFFFLCYLFNPLGFEKMERRNLRPT